VTGVGGTEFTGDPEPVAVTAGCAAADTYWAASCSPTSPASALSYIPETTWNDGASSQGFSVGGGGASNVFGKPSWQSGSGVPSDGRRDVPDVALNASNGHDSYLICSQDFFVTGGSAATSCTSSFRASDQTLAAIGGTSAGAPAFAGILALINQATSSNGLGNVNPMLYQLAATPANGAFHDVSSGTNKVPCTAGSTNCPSGTPSIGFTAGAGYDQVTGLGSLDVTKLITAWLAVTPVADFYIDGLVTSVPSPGGSGTSTITVSSIGGFTGNVSLTCTPNAAAHISCSLLPTSVNVTAGGQPQTSVLSITTLARLDLPAGAHPRGIWLATGGSTLFVALVLCCGPSRRRRNVILGFLLVASITTIVSCGGGSGGGGGGGGGGTPTGTYVITVTGTGPSTSHSTTVSVLVK
jgi:subtilase family serine protease